MAGHNVPKYRRAGEYVAAIVDGANVAVSVFDRARYQIADNLVTVWFVVNIDPTAADLLTQFRISLPPVGRRRAFDDINDVIGLCAPNPGLGGGGTCVASVANQDVLVSYAPAVDTAEDIIGSFNYRIS